MPPAFIDINADLGESLEALNSGSDRELMRFITSANIACGGHAGDDASMRRMLSAARDLNVVAGAHPSYPDRKNFGRLTMQLEPEQLEAALYQQIESLIRVAEPLGIPIRHVKPHGALYHDARNPRIAEAIGRAVLRLDPLMVMIGQAGFSSLEHWRALGLRCAAEAFADRAYQRDGTLRPRSQPGAVLMDPVQAARQALDIALHHRVTTPDGDEVVINADTICIHSDTPNAADIARQVKRRLAESGIELAPVPHSSLPSA